MEGDRSGRDVLRLAPNEVFRQQSKYRTTGVAEKVEGNGGFQERPESLTPLASGKTVACECVNAFLGDHPAKWRISLVFSATTRMANWGPARKPQLVLV